MKSKNSEVLAVDSEMSEGVLPTDRPERGHELIGVRLVVAHSISHFLSRAREHPEVNAEE